MIKLIQSPYDFVRGIFFRIAATGLISSAWFVNEVPSKRARKEGELQLELVSHCWQYSHLLTYQLSSIVNYPPKNLKLTVTIYYCNEDAKTVALLDFFNKHQIKNVTWNWQSLPKEKLFRRGIGRNQAAKNTKADWIWFTDCDAVFHKNCFDQLAQELQGRDDVLVYPSAELTTDLLAEDDPVLSAVDNKPQVVDLDVTQFSVHKLTRATGPFQITHGDVARTCGYCENIGIYQKPSDVWCKAYEDKAFRWLIGSDGTPLDIDNVYRIRHVFKGRYKKNSAWSSFRQAVRKLNFGYK